jgi:hypothetical protein
MAKNQLLDALAADAASLGWSAPTGIDHIIYTARAVRGMRTLATVEPWAPRALRWTYAKEADDLDPPGLATGWDWSGEGVEYVAIAAPRRWAAEVALLAAGRRRTGRAQKLVQACWRIQMSMVRAGIDPVGRQGARATPIRDDGRTRQPLLLARETELERERDWNNFWQIRPGGEAASRARPSREAQDDVRWPEDYEGWEL